jgi:transcriptional regulator with XRE-family HTH domain
VDRAQLADFLRRRREALQPEDVGLPPGSRRRTTGLRREEVASLADMSTDYYGRLEQQRGPQPSEQMLAAIARALRLTLDERDHLFRLSGHTPPRRSSRTDHVSPALLRVLYRLDTPAQVVSDLGEALAQNHLAVALVGDQTKYVGLERCVAHRWFLGDERRLYPPEDHARLTRVFAAAVRGGLARNPDEKVQALLAELLAGSDEFVQAWERHEVGLKANATKRFLHPEVGRIEVHCQTLVDENDAQMLLVYTATPGSEDAERLALLSVLGRTTFSAEATDPT